MDRLSYLYKATCVITGKSYIGQSIDPIGRIRDHIISPNSTYFHRSIRKYGVENFIWEVIESSVPEERINEREIEAIKNYGTRAPCGYNLTDGGDGQKGYICSDEKRRKISEAHKRKRFRHSLETKLKMSLAKKGNPRTEETKRKISNTMKERFSKNI